MPNRWIKESYCSSERIMSVSAEARDLWVRLLVNADDHGLFDARPQIVASSCFPLNPVARKCEQLLADLESADLIRRYEVEGKPYLMITRWYERARSKPKYPLPPEGLLAVANNCEQLQKNAAPTTTTTTTRHAKRATGSTKTTPPGDWWPKEQSIERMSREFGLVPEDVPRYVAAFLDACQAKGYQYRDFDAAWCNSVRQDWGRLRASGVKQRAADPFAGALG